ncbi:MAG: MATE family efflux transporter [Candidatus Omnitrophica bacterium]|nr:MATE family efflux transporter [Candidatus Omnitrophota bacterium]
MDRANQMGTKPIARLLAKFAIPSIFSLVLHAMYNIVDRIFIGRGVGSLGLAGVTLCFPMLLFIFAFCLLFSSGSASLISLLLGKQEKDKAEQVFGNTFAIMTITAVLITFLGLFFSEQILNWMSVGPQVYPYARDYLRILFGGSIFFFYGFFLTFIIRAEGNPVYATLMMVVATVVNLILDPIFIFIMHMGTGGAALATIISEAVIVLMGLLYIMRKQGLLHIRRKNLNFNWPNIGQIVYLGLSPALMDIAASIQITILNSRLVILGGDIAVAAMGIIFSITSLIALFTFGMAAGMQPIIGYNYGAGNYRRVEQTFRYACISTLIIILFAVILIIVFSRQIAMLFCNSDPGLIDLSSHGLRIFICMYPLVGIQILGTRYFQAVGKGVHAVLIGISRQLFLFIPILYVLSIVWGVEGVWLSSPVTEILATVVTAFFLARELKLLKLKIKAQPKIV